MFTPSEPEHAKEFDCPTCGEAQSHDDDFCHECGHSFSWGDANRGDSLPDASERGERCPMCPTGEIHDLEYGVRQCDSCGYTARDWSTA